MDRKDLPNPADATQLMGGAPAGDATQLMGSAPAGDATQLMGAAPAPDSATTVMGSARTTQMPPSSVIISTPTPGKRANTSHTARRADGLDSSVFRMRISCSKS